MIFSKVQAFVGGGRTKHADSKLTMRNDFPARERKFISTLAEDLNLSVTWDEYDDEDRNLVTFRFPGSAEAPPAEEGEEKGSAKEGSEWEDVDSEEDEESRAAIERVLKKYERAPVADDDEEGGFEARHARSVREKMDEWKRGYYQVSSHHL